MTYLSQIWSQNDQIWPTLPPEWLITRFKNDLATVLSQSQLTMDLYRKEKHILAIFVCIFGFIDFQN